LLFRPAGAKAGGAEPARGTLAWPMPEPPRFDDDLHRRPSGLWWALVFAVGLLAGVQLALHGDELRQALVPTHAPGSSVVDTALSPGERLSKDAGDFVVRYDRKPADPSLASGYELLRGSRVAEATASQLNQRLGLPADVEIVIGEKKADLGPLYETGQRRIVIQPSYAANTLQLISTMLEDGADDQARKLTIGALRETIYHEVGHALVDQLALPVTGREEDVADEFAAFMTIKQLELGPVPALGQVVLWRALSQPAWSLRDTDLADEHSLNQQRAYDLACDLVGSDPENTQMQELLSKTGAGVTDLERCRADWARLEGSWRVLLSPYLLAGARG
jgi:hypothetical protein